MEIEDRIVLTLEYWREDRTYFHIGNSCGISKSTVCRIVHAIEDALMQSGRFRLPGKKHLARGFGKLEVVALNVTKLRWSDLNNGKDSSSQIRRNGIPSSVN
ncbi:transposase family protein [Coleofasciculus sp. FACHB-129]|nr:transposase family protein [Coleofasciculus sp. FACHB-129]MBD1893423.1 transposase family protein [Coleofasciculus sp. FACHB-129]